MKKLIAILTTAILLTMTSCQSTGVSSENPSNIANQSSLITSQENESLHSDNTAWNITSLPEPMAVDSFEVAVMVQIGDPAETIPQRTYWKEKVLETGYYRFIGTYNDRYYFFGRDEEEQKEFVITSCDKNSENFEIHSDITEQIGHLAWLYNGAFYNLIDNDLYVYDLQTKEFRMLIDRTDDDSKLGKIVAITDGWIFFSDYNGITTEYCIKTGEIIESPNSIVGVGVDKKLFGVQFANDQFISEMMVSYDPFNNVLTEIRGTKNYKISNRVMIDDNGDVWAKEYPQDGEYTNYTLRKIHDSESLDGAYNSYYDEIINGWYYYRYIPNGSEEQYLARLNLSTGETQYCPSIYITNHYYELSHYFWGSTLEN